MSIATFIDYFIHESYYQNSNNNKLGRARLLIRACFLTSIFSNAYVLLNIYFEFDRGLYIMMASVVGFLFAPFLLKTKFPLIWLGNIFIGIGAFAIFTLTYYTGGAWSAIYPWIIAVPILALLIVDKASGYLWGVLSFIVVMLFAWLAYTGYEFPVEYNPAKKTIWYLSMLPGLLLIIFLIALEFKNAQYKALKSLKVKNKMLELQKETIQNQSNKLKNSIEEKDYIIRILAHDLSNPLSNITSALGLMESEKSADRHQEYMSIINKSTRTATNLVDRVLEMDALGHSIMRAHPEIVSLCAVLNEVVIYMNENAIKKQIEINIKNESKRCAVHADKTYLFQIFENLLSNAIKFSFIGTMIDVVIENNSETVIVKVIDQGPGIPGNEIDKLFKKFTKLSPRPTAGENSTGLGLSLVKRYTTLSNGKVWYEGSEGKGAIFAVELPLVNS